jgi:hypothetical protein
MTVNTENKQVEKTEQVNPQQVVKVTPENGTAEAKAEPQPNIKSEENQANWKAFREKQAAERKAREDAERRAAEEAQKAEALRLALEAAVSKPNNRQMNEYGSDPSEETEEQRIDRRVEAAIKQREAAAEKKRLEREAQELPQRLNEVYPDFQNVCTHENMDYLKFHYPEVAKAYQYLPDNFDTWTTVYKAIKRFVPNQEQAKHDAQKVEKNLSKPGSISTTSNTSSGQGKSSQILSEERRMANWERMQRTIRSLKD